MKIILADIPLKHLKGEAATEAPNLGLLHIASYTKHKNPNTQIKYLEPYLSLNQHLKQLKQFNPEIYGLSFATPLKTEAYSLIEKVRNTLPNTKIVVGGTHPTVNPIEVLQKTPTDICVIGEGEKTFTQITFGMPLAKIKGIAYRQKQKIKINPPQPLLENINFMPAWGLIDFKKYNIPIKKQWPVAYLLPSRGCPYNCTFCSNPVWKNQKPWVRHRTPENIAQEVLYLHKRGVKEIFLRSDTFNTNSKWTIQVCEAIKELNLPNICFQCNLRSDKVNHKLAKALSEINCWLTHIGIESANNRVLKGINKQITIQQSIRACRTLTQHKIKVYGFFMLYNAWLENNQLEYETTQECQQTIKFAEQMLKKGYIEYVSFYFAYPIIGSQLHEIAKKHGLIPENQGIIKMQLPAIAEREMLKTLRKGLCLQLKNGFEKNIINKQSAPRIYRKIKLLLQILKEEENLEPRRRIGRNPTQKSSTIHIARANTYP